MDLTSYRKISHARIWFEFLGQVILAWLLMFSALFVSGPLTIVIWAMTIYCWFRLVQFGHEALHLGSKIALLQEAYDIFVGLWSKCPLYFQEAHWIHHNHKTYATERDPEFVDLRKAGKMAQLFLFLRIPFFAVLILFKPILILLNIHPRSAHFYFKHTARATMNNEFQVHLSSQQKMRILLMDAAGVLVLIVQTFFPLTLLLNYLLLNYVLFTSWYRNLVIHHLDPSAEITAATIVHNISTALFAPYNHTYHALHHMEPAIPYYALPKVHEILLQKLDQAHPYRKTVLSHQNEFFFKNLKNIENKRGKI